MFITVGRDSNEPPAFLSSPYVSALNETAAPGRAVLAVSANDPDGPDAELDYYVQEGAADTFEISGTGEIRVAEGEVIGEVIGEGGV